MITAIATRIVRRPGIATAAIVLLVLLAGAIGGTAPERLADAPGDDFADVSAETWTTLERLEAAADDGGTNVLALIDLEGEGWPSAVAAEQVARIQSTVEAQKGVARVDGPIVKADAPAQVQAASSGFISKDGSQALLAIATDKDADRNAVAVALRDELASDDSVRLGGFALVDEDLNAQVEADLGRAEAFAFPLLFVVSIWVFGSLVAAFLPLIAGVGAIMFTFLGLVLFDMIEPMSVFAINLVFALGLGLAVDYSLLLVTRVREARGAGHGPRSAVLAAVRATSSTIMFSALTVAAAMAALTLFPQRFLWSMGVGGVMCALLAAIVSLTLLPAVLALLGDRIDSLSPRKGMIARQRAGNSSTSGGWATLTRHVMRRPGLIAVVTSAGLLLLASPLLRVEFTGVDATVLPSDSVPRAVAAEVVTAFPQVGAAQLTVVAESTPEQLDDAVAVALKGAGAAGAAVGEPAPAREAGDGLASLELPMRVNVNDERARDLVEHLRAKLPDEVDAVGVTGPTTITVDTLDSFASIIPWAILLTASTTFVLVFLFTGSIVLPLKAILMNALSVSAALGLLVLIFQDGRFESLFGYTSQGALESSQPILIVAIAFGLSTDYGIILLGRIREEKLSGLDDRDAVAAGVQRTGTLITSAALLLSIALGAFITSQIIFIKQIGVGSVAAVLIDATIIRALLVPSLMVLLGRWNWWAPRPLRRLHDRIGVREMHSVGEVTDEDRALDAGSRRGRGDGSDVDADRPLTPA